MIFSDLYKSPRTTLSKFRNSFPHGPPPPPSDLDADLVSRDKTKNKEAVRRFLAEKVRNDWDFTWPEVAPPTAEHASPTQGEPVAQGAQDDGPQSLAAVSTTLAAEEEEAPRDPGEEADRESDAESVYSTISEDAAHFRPRADWTSDLSDNDEPPAAASPFRFDSPDTVGAVVRDSIETKRARRRRAVRDETKWNPGLACFEARRSAWTGAKTVRVKPKPQSPVSPSSTRRLFWRHHRTQSSISHSAIVTSGSPPAPTSPIHSPPTRTSTTTASESDSGVQRTTSQDSSTPAILYPVHTVVPVPPPLLPAQNPMRASIQPSMYGSLYDKVVVQSLQPSCPVNLADMLRACVVGWKRDGEWPPRPTYPVAAAASTLIQSAPTAEVLAQRQRKAQQQRAKNAAAAAAGPTAGRRLSLVGFFNGGNAASKTAAAPAPAPTPAAQENGNAATAPLAQSHSQSHSDEGAGSSGKTLFRRSLQKVLSLGQHGHAHGGSNAPAGPLSPTSPVTAAG